MQTGSCLCGGIRFRISSELAPIQVCHCSQCRKAQGSAFATNSPITAGNFELDSGADLLTYYESSPGKKRHFCKRCGSPIYSTRDTAPSVLRIRVGVVDEPLSASVGLHFHTASKAAWWTIDDDLPQFAGEYPPRAGAQ